jgi:hypothetical protein
MNSFFSLDNYLPSTIHQSHDIYSKLFHDNYILLHIKQSKNEDQDYVLLGNNNCSIVGSIITVKLRSDDLKFEVKVFIYKNYNSIAKFESFNLDRTV